MTKKKFTSRALVSKIERQTKLHIQIHFPFSLTKNPTFYSRFPLPPKPLLLHRPQNTIRDEGKRKRQLEPDIASITRRADMFPNGPDEPHLRHAHDGAEDAEAKGRDGGDAGGQEVRGGVDGRVVAADAAFEEEVFGERDAFVYGEPVTLQKEERLALLFVAYVVRKKERDLGRPYNNQHEIFQYALKMAISGDSNGAIHQCPHKGPYESRHRLRPSPQDLQAQPNAVDVGAIVRNDAESQYDEAELAKASQWREEHGGE